MLAGFVEAKGTREQIVNIRIIIEKCRHQNMPLYVCFIDYAKAFDCVTHRNLWDTMEQMGFPVRHRLDRNRAWSDARLHDITRDVQHLF